jgi:hypothetical protein
MFWEPWLMRRIFIALMLVVSTLPGFAQDAPEAGGKPGANVDLPILIAPMNDADGKLVSYAYITSRLTAGTPGFALDARDKLAFIQDAFVRDVNGASITGQDNPATVEKAALQARLLADARRVMGAKKIVSISIVNIQIAPLHPVQSSTPNGSPAFDSAPATASPPPSGG